MMYVVPTNFALNKSIELITTTVIGGLGSLTGSVLGAMLVTLLPEVFRSLSNYRMLIYGFAVVLIIMFRPNGLYGYKEFSLKRLIAKIKGLRSAGTAEAELLQQAEADAAYYQEALRAIGETGMN